MQPAISNPMQRDVHEFLVKHLGADRDGWATPTGLVNKWLLVREEYDELTRALDIRHADQDARVDVAGAVDAICDLLYVVLNLCEELKIDIQPFFDEVHRSNMTKTPGRLSRTKKVLKGPDYSPARIAEMLLAYRERQLLDAIDYMGEANDL